MAVRLQLSKWQKRFVLDEFDSPLRIAVTGIGSGKSRALAVWIVMQCMQKPGLRGIVLAQTYRALSRVLVRELEVVCSLIGVRYDFNKSSMEFSFPNKSILYMYSGENPNGLLGLSSVDLLAVDESAYLPREVYDFSRDRMRASKYSPMVRLISSPVNDQIENWFRDICMQHPDNVVHAATYENPFVSESFIQELKDRYIEGSNLYKQQVEGLFLDTDVASQIVKKADFVAEKKYSNGDAYWFGADFSGGVGCDNDVFIVIDETGVVEYQKDDELNTQQKVAVVKMMYDKYRVVSNYVDNTGGFGKGTIDLASEKNISLQGANFSEKPFKEEYPNLRTEAYMELAAAIRGGFWVPPEIRPEILAQQMVVDNRGRVALVPKELAKKALGHSPDASDALALAVYSMNHGDRSSSRTRDYTDKEASEALDRMLAACAY